MEPGTIARVLSEIAETASETLRLQEVFDRVARSVRELIPFDQMGVVRLVEGGRAVTHATTVPSKRDPVCSQPWPLTAWSPRIRPRPGPNPRIDDAQVELDPAFPADAELLGVGVRSTLWEPFRSASSFNGGVWLCSRQPHNFTDRHQEVLRPIAALLGSAVEHWRIWDAEKRRRDRLDQLEGLLATLAESLDVREVFERVSHTVQPILPHHLLVLTELDASARTFRVVAYAGESDGPAPEGPIQLTEQESERRFLDFEIVEDLDADVALDTEPNRALRATGMRVPVRLWGEVRGMVGFFHREPSSFGEQDVELARRLADRITLALSHHRLAEQARIAAAARESAERLTATVETLTRELESRNPSRIVGTSRSWKETLQHVGRVASS